MSNMRHLTNELIHRHITICAMESCTGGLFASRLTDTEGASDIFVGSFVAYSNEAKIRCGVPAEVIARCGVYSRDTAEAMAMAAREAYGADVGVGITGSLGRTDPRNADSVPGEVWIAVRRGTDGRARSMTLSEEGADRAAAKERIVEETAELLLTMLGDSDCEKLP